MQYFSWDSAKSKANIGKHGISFQTARLAFNDPHLVRNFDRIVGDETRWHTTGMVEGHLLLLIVHTTQEDNGDEYIRIISARKANRREEAAYFGANRALGNF